MFIKTIQNKKINGINFNKINKNGKEEKFLNFIIIFHIYVVVYLWKFAQIFFFKITKKKYHIFHHFSKKNI